MPNRGLPYVELPVVLQYCVPRLVDLQNGEILDAASRPCCFVYFLDSLTEAPDHVWLERRWGGGPKIVVVH